MSISLELEDGKLKLSGYSHVHILIVGAGGTGSYVIAHLGRFLSYLEKIRPELEVTVTIADGDAFEEKNRERQVCYNADLDKNKARVQARKIGNLFGVTCFFYDRYIENVDKCAYLLSPHNFSYDTLSILIGNVDNNATRQILHETFIKGSHKNVVYIDSGNNDKAGQVVLGLKLNDEVMLPPVGFYHPEIISDSESQVPSQQSCAQRMSETPQAMMANVWASSIVTSMLTNLLELNMVETIVSYFNSQSISVKSHVTIEKFLENYKASFYYHTNIRNWEMNQSRDWKATDETNLLGYDPDHEVVKNLHGEPCTVTLLKKLHEVELKFTLVAVTDTGNELRLVPHITDSRTLSITGRPMEVNMNWREEEQHRLKTKLKQHLWDIIESAERAYNGPGIDKEINVAKALAGMYGLVVHKHSAVAVKTAA